jgi:hypothetical protein
MLLFRPVEQHELETVQEQEPPAAKAKKPAIRSSLLFCLECNTDKCSVPLPYTIATVSAARWE